METKLSKALEPDANPEIPEHHYLNADHGIKSWLLTTDHKRIAILYLVTISFFFLLGGIYVVLEAVNEQGAKQGDRPPANHAKEVMESWKQGRAEGAEHADAEIGQVESVQTCAANHRHLERILVGREAVLEREVHTEVAQVHADFSAGIDANTGVEVDHRTAHAVSNQRPIYIDVIIPGKVDRRAARDCQRATCRDCEVVGQINNVIEPVLILRQGTGS